MKGRLLSRSLEDSATVTSVLVPWNTCGVMQSSVLGVPTLVYAPYCFFNIISPIISIICAAIGFRIFKFNKPLMKWHLRHKHCRKGCKRGGGGSGKNICRER